MDINDLSFQDLLAEGLPVHVAARVAEERKTHGEFKNWNDLVVRLFYAPQMSTTESGGPAQPVSLGKKPEVRPVDQRLMADTLGLLAGGASGKDPLRGGTASGELPWWERPDQGLGGVPDAGWGAKDDSFPAGDQCDVASLGDQCDVASLGDQCDVASLGDQCDVASLGDQCDVASLGDQCDVAPLGDQCDIASLGDQVFDGHNRGKCVVCPPVERGKDAARACPACNHQPSSSSQIGQVDGRNMPMSKRDTDPNENASTPTPRAARQRRGESEAPVPGGSASGTMQGLQVITELVVQGKAEHSVPKRANAKLKSIQRTVAHRQAGRGANPFGRDVQNVAATHWFARMVKSNRLLPSVVVRQDGHNPLGCGLTDTMLQSFKCLAVDQLVQGRRVLTLIHTLILIPIRIFGAELWESRHRLPVALQATAAFKVVLSALLLTNWRKGDYKDIFNPRTGILHTSPPGKLFDALMSEFHVATTPLVAGWHLGLLVGLPDDPETSTTSSRRSSRLAGGWPEPPPRQVVFRSYNQILDLAAALKLPQFDGLPPVDAEVAEGGLAQTGSGEDRQDSSFQQPSPAFLEMSAPLSDVTAPRIPSRQRMVSTSSQASVEQLTGGTQTPPLSHPTQPTQPALTAYIASSFPDAALSQMLPGSQLEAGRGSGTDAALSQMLPGSQLEARRGSGTDAALSQMLPGGQLEAGRGSGTNTDLSQMLPGSQLEAGRGSGTDAALSQMLPGGQLEAGRGSGTNTDLSQMLPGSQLEAGRGSGTDAALSQMLPGSQLEAGRGSATDAALSQMLPGGQLEAGRGSGTNTDLSQLLPVSQLGSSLGRTRRRMNTGAGSGVGVGSGTGAGSDASAGYGTGAGYGMGAASGVAAAAAAKAGAVSGSGETIGGGKAPPEVLADVPGLGPPAVQAHNTGAHPDAATEGGGATNGGGQAPLKVPPAGSVHAAIVNSGRQDRFTTALAVATAAATAATSAARTATANYIRTADEDPTGSGTSSTAGTEPAHISTSSRNSTRTNTQIPPTAARSGLGLNRGAANQRTPPGRGSTTAQNPVPANRRSGQAWGADPPAWRSRGYTQGGVGRSAQGSALHGADDISDVDPLPKGISMAELISNYQVPQWAKETHLGYQPPNAVILPPPTQAPPRGHAPYPLSGPARSASKYSSAPDQLPRKRPAMAWWNPEFEPSRALSHAGSPPWISTSLNRTTQGVESQAVKNYTNELYLYRSELDEEELRQYDQYAKGGKVITGSTIASRIFKTRAKGLEEQQPARPPFNLGGAASNAQRQQRAAVNALLPSAAANPTGPYIIPSVGQVQRGPFGGPGNHPGNVLPAGDPGHQMYNEGRGGWMQRQWNGAASGGAPAAWPGEYDDGEHWPGRSALPLGGREMQEQQQERMRQQQLEQQRHSYSFGWGPPQQQRQHVPAIYHAFPDPLARFGAFLEQDYIEQCIVQGEQLRQRADEQKEWEVAWHQKWSETYPELAQQHRAQEALSKPYPLHLPYSGQPPPNQVNQVKPTDSSQPDSDYTIPEEEQQQQQQQQHQQQWLNLPAGHSPSLHLGPSGPHPYPGPGLGPPLIPMAPLPPGYTLAGAPLSKLNPPHHPMGLAPPPAFYPHFSPHQVQAMWEAGQMQCPYPHLQPSSAQNTQPPGAAHPTDPSGVPVDLGSTPGGPGTTNTGVYGSAQAGQPGTEVPQPGMRYNSLGNFSPAQMQQVGWESAQPGSGVQQPGMRYNSLGNSNPAQMQQAGWASAQPGVQPAQPGSEMGQGTAYVQQAGQGGGSALPQQQGGGLAHTQQDLSAQIQWMIPPPGRLTPFTYPVPNPFSAMPAGSTFQSGPGVQDAQGSGLAPAPGIQLAPDQIASGLSQGAQSTGGASGQATSPYVQATSPNGQATSPYGQATSPNGQATSPNGQATSPYGQATSPNGQAASPYGQATTPNGQATSPYGQATSPNGQATTPNGQATSPYGQATSPYGQSNSPYSQAASSYGQANSPYGQANSPYSQAASPYGQATSPNGQATSPLPPMATLEQQQKMLALQHQQQQLMLLQQLLALQPQLLPEPPIPGLDPSDWYGTSDPQEALNKLLSQGGAGQGGGPKLTKEQKREEKLKKKLEKEQERSKLKEMKKSIRATMKTEVAAAAAVAAGGGEQGEGGDAPATTQAPTTAEGAVESEDPTSGTPPATPLSSAPSKGLFNRWKGAIGKALKVKIPKDLEPEDSVRSDSEFPDNLQSPSYPPLFHEGVSPKEGASLTAGSTSAPLPPSGTTPPPHWHYGDDAPPHGHRATPEAGSEPPVTYAFQPSTSAASGDPTSTPNPSGIASSGTPPASSTAPPISPPPDQAPADKRAPAPPSLDGQPPPLTTPSATAVHLLQGSTPLTAPSATAVPLLQGSTPLTTPRDTPTGANIPTGIEAGATPGGTITPGNGDGGGTGGASRTPDGGPEPVGLLASGSAAAPGTAPAGAGGGGGDGGVSLTPNIATEGHQLTAERYSEWQQLQSESVGGTRLNKPTPGTTNEPSRQHASGMLGGLVGRLFRSPAPAQPPQGSGLTARLNGSSLTGSGVASGSTAGPGSGGGVGRGVSDADAAGVDMLRGVEHKQQDGTGTEGGGNPTPAAQDAGQLSPMPTQSEGVGQGGQAVQVAGQAVQVQVQTPQKPISQSPSGEVRGSPSIRNRIGKWFSRTSASPVAPGSSGPPPKASPPATSATITPVTASATPSATPTATSSATPTRSVSSDGTADGTAADAPPPTTSSTPPAANVSTSTTPTSTTQRAQRTCIGGGGGD
eukprot:gene31642-6837_t